MSCRYRASMQPFRRPLGVILFCLLAIVAGIVMSEAAAHLPGDPWWLAMIGGWVVTIAFFVALGALVVIVRRRRAKRQADIIAAGVEQGMRRARGY